MPIRATTRITALVGLIGILGSIALNGHSAARAIRVPPIAFKLDHRQVGDMYALGTYIAERYPELAQPAVRRITATGTDWVREEFKASHLHAGKDLPYYFPRYDGVVEQERAAGLHILGLLDYNNTFNGRDHVWMGHKHMYNLANNFVQYAAAVAEHYRHQIYYWQIWNEPDIRQRWRPRPNAADYAYLLRRTYTAIKDVNPHAKVVLAGPSGSDPYAVQYIQDVVRNNGRFDIAAIQPYTWIPTPAIQAEVRILHHLHKPVWFTEIGWSGQKDCTACGDPLVQANKMATIFLIGAISRVRRVFWYDFRDDGDRPVFWDHFGLVAYNFRGKPDYRAYVIGLYLLNNAQLLARAQISPLVSLYRFRSHHRVFYALWNSSTYNQPVALPWQWRFANVDTATGRHITGTYGHHLTFTMRANSVYYLVPRTLKIHWRPSLPFAIPPASRR